MKEFTAADFAKTGNEMYFGPDYENYGAVQLRHLQTRKTIDILVTATGETINTPNHVTKRMKERMQISGDAVKVVALSIAGETVLSILFPEVAPPFLSTKTSI